ncbi:hypothetical protein C8A06_1140 [Microbacteriaceae bacterium MWH-Ta3]|nr:hypothetical protein C8A06_1140 [Microbacteriaceae bacterium MWH-Ta3]
MKKSFASSVAFLTMLILASLSACAPTVPTATVTATDAWMKAVPADAMMTGAFMTLTNSTDADITVDRAYSDLAGIVELHEMAMVDGEMIMRKAESPIVIPAGESFDFAPGGFHFMFMGLEGAIDPGTTVALTIVLSDGSEVIVDVVAREYDAANETYVGDGSTD